MRTRPQLIAACLLFAAASTAGAQDKPWVEIAPFVGYRFGGSVIDAYGGSHSINDSQSTGVAIAVPLDAADKIELLYSHQGTNVLVGTATGSQHYPIAIDYWMLGATREFVGANRHVRPFLAGYFGVGDVSSSQGSIAGGNRVSLGVGGGVKLDLSRVLALRFDAKAILTYVDLAGGMFCSGGSCAASFSGNGLLQGEVAAGLVVKL